MYGQIAAIIAPIFICAGIGFYWSRSRRSFDADFVTSLMTLVGTPCLVASTLTRLQVTPAAMGEIAAAAAAVFAGAALLGTIVLRAMRLPLHSYLPAVMFPNAGNMGLPLCLFAFGDHGLALAIVFFAVASTLQHSVGVMIAAGRLDIGRLARMPLLYALAVSLAFVATGTPVPAWLANTIQLIGGVTIPLMLIALGVSLAQLRISSLRHSLVLSVVRIAGGAALGAGVGWAMGLDGTVRGVLMIQSAMPVAVYNYLFAQLFRRRPEEVAGMIVLSTALSFATLPLLLLLVL